MRGINLNRRLVRSDFVSGIKWGLGLALGKTTLVGRGFSKGRLVSVEERKKVRCTADDA